MGDITWIGYLANGDFPGDGLSWGDPYNWSPECVPGVDDTVTISKGAVQSDLHPAQTVKVRELSVDGDVQLSAFLEAEKFSWKGKCTSADSVLTVTKEFRWSGGHVGSLTVRKDAALIFEGPADKELIEDCILRNYGDIILGRQRSPGWKGDASNAGWFKFSVSAERSGSEGAAGVTSDAAEGGNVAIISYDEKPGIQAIGNTAPDLPPQPGTHETSRATTNTSARHVEPASRDRLLTGVHARVEDRHRSREFVGFLRRLDAAYPWTPPSG